MTKDEIRMTNEIRKSNDEGGARGEIQGRRFRSATGVGWSFASEGAMDCDGAWGE